MKMASKGFCYKALVISSFLLLVAFVWAQGLGEWKVLVATEASEQTAKSRLDNDLVGIENLEVQFHNGQWSILYGSFDTQAAAEQASEELANREGLLLQGVVMVSGDSGSSTSNPSGTGSYRVLVSKYTSKADAEEKKRELQGEGFVPVDINESNGQYFVLVGIVHNTYAEAEENISYLQEAGIVTEAIVDINNMDDYAGGTATSTRDYKMEIANFIRLRDAVSARLTLDEWLRLDPGNLEALQAKVQVEKLEEEVRSDATSMSEERKQYEDWKQKAAEYEAEEKYDNAIDIWKDISRLNIVSEAQRRTAMQKIDELVRRRSNLERENIVDNMPSDDEGGNMGLILGGIIGVIVIGGGVFFMMKKKGATGGAAPASADQSPQLAPAPPTPTSALGPAPPTPAPTKEEEPAPSQASSGVSETEVDLTRGKQAPQMEDFSPIPIAKESASGDASINIEESEPEIEEEDVAEAAAPVSSAQKHYFYQQDFQDEEVGQLPKDWDGNYDYASLLVTEEGGQRCMKFDKPSGTGSALFQCKFPNAGGRVGVEFDMRCDHKNKYLLGFYIEKDADFRHSVHTVVHRDIANPDNITLRLQNESAPYQLGQWVHIKFLIDLPRSIVDAYIDGKQVALGVRLTSKPNVVNTLSIRDNLATEGTLLIRNIEIYRES